MFVFFGVSGRIKLYYEKVFVFVMAAVFCGCDRKREARISVPRNWKWRAYPHRRDRKSPASPGSSVTIQGQGFTANSEIWLRAITRAADVQAEVTDVTATTVTFTAPDVSGEQNILLKQDGGEWILGVLHFPEVPNTPGGEQENRRSADPNFACSRYVGGGYDLCITLYLRC